MENEENKFFITFFTINKYQEKLDIYSNKFLKSSCLFLDTEGVRIYPPTVLYRTVPYPTVFREGPFRSTAQRTVLF